MYNILYKVYNYYQYLKFYNYYIYISLSLLRLSWKKIIILLQIMFYNNLRSIAVLGMATLQDFPMKKKSCFLHILYEAYIQHC